jgi:actin-related protein 6
MIFEEWEFQSYFRCTRELIASTWRGDLADIAIAAALIPYGGLFGDEGQPACIVLVDVGYSFTHVIPLRDGQIIWDHVKRFVIRKLQVMDGVRLIGLVSMLAVNF